MKTIDPNSVNKPANIAILCCALSFIAYSANYMGRATLSTLAVELSNINVLSTQLFGIACSIFSVIYAVGRFICGYCGDLIPAKKMICIGVVVSGLCNLFIGLTLNRFAIVILWTLNAIAQSMVYGPLLVVAAAVCTQNNKTLYMLFIALSSTCGQLMGYIVIPFMVKLAGLRFGFIVPGLYSVLATLLVSFLMPVIPAKGKLTSISFNTIIGDLKFFFSNKDFQFMLLPCVANGIIRDGYTVWLVSFIMRTYGIDLSSLAYFAVAVPIVNSLGKFIFPGIYKLAKENDLRVGLISYACIFLLTIPLCFSIKTPIIAIICIAMGSLMTGIANLAFVGMWPLRFSSSNKVSLASGMIDMPIYMGAGISSAVFGFTVERFGFRSIYITIVLIAFITMIPLALSQKKK